MADLGREITPGFLQFPPEIICMIAQILYLDGGKEANSLFPLSLTCVILRQMTLPILFHYKKVDVTHAQHVGEASEINKDLSFLENATDNVLEHVNSFQLTRCRKCSVVQETILGGHIDTCLRRIFGKMKNLSLVRFDPPSRFLLAVLNQLRRRPMHIILDLRDAQVYLRSDVWRSLSSEASWTFSLAVHDGSWTKNLIPIDLPSRLRALEWSHPIFQEPLKHVEFLNKLYGSQLLEEIHVSEKELDVRGLDTTSYSSRVCHLLVSLPALRRLRVEGSELVGNLLKVLPELTSIEDLSLYSSYRSVFHTQCSEDENGPTITTSMPWLALPRLRKLDIRFICRHFSIEKIVPSGLKALRIEFYGPEDRLSVMDLRWLSQHCPDLERLEFDLGDLSVVSLNEVGLLRNDPTSLLLSLQNFRRLHILRIFPSYWRDGRMRVHPLPDQDWPVLLFRRLRYTLASLHVLTICMSYGEYPFDIIPQMAVSKRPKKFTVRWGAENEILLQHYHACTRRTFERSFNFDQSTKVLKSSKHFCDPNEAFFDDFGEDWILPHVEIVHVKYPYLWS